MEETICAGTRKADGLPCVAKAPDGSDFCHHHDPDRSEERRASASRAGKVGGRGRGSRIEQLERIRSDLRSVAAGVLRGEISSRQADSICRALSAELRAVNDLHKMQDVADLERRLDELEDLFA